MDDIVFCHCQPPSASSSQAPRLLGALASSNISKASITSRSVRQAASQLNQQNGISKDHVVKSHNVSDLFLQRQFSNQHHRNDLIQEQENIIATRNFPDSGDDNDLPEIDELLSDMVQKNDSIYADPNSGGDDGFVDIDEFLSGIRQESINSGSMAEKVDSRTRSGSPRDSICSTEESSQDPIMLNDDESMGAESETDYGGLDVGLRTRSDSDSLYVTDNKPADGDSISLRTIHTSGRLAADHPDDGNKNNNGLVNDTQLRLSANRPGSASPGHRSAIYQASKLRINTDITQGNTNYVNLDVTKELKEGEFSVFAKKRDEDDNDTYSMKRSKSSTVSGDDPAFDGNMSKLQDDLPDHAQSLQPGPAATSLHQSDLKDHLQEQLRRSPTGNVGRKRPYMTAPIRLANTASTVSAALGSADLEEAQPNALTAAPVEDQERELRDINLEMVNDRDYTNKSDAAGSQIGGRPRSRKRVRRTKDTEDDDVAAPSTHSLDASYQAAAVTSSDGIHESEEIPIHGYLTLKTIKSKVVYCLTFSQEVLPHTRDRGQRQDIAKSVSSSSNRRDLERSPVQKRALNRPVRNSPFSPEDDELLLQLKGDGFSWDEISKRFPERSKGTLQVHYSTKLKRRLETCKMTRKPRRDG